MALIWAYSGAVIGKLYHSDAEAKEVEPTPPADMKDDAPGPVAP